MQSAAAGKLRRSDGSHTTNTKERADICKQHFQVLLNCHWTVQPAVHARVQQQQRDWNTSQDLPSDEVPTLQEVATAVGALKNYRAAGVSGICPEMIKYDTQDGLRMLHLPIVDVWHMCKDSVPEDWRTALTVPLL